MFGKHSKIATDADADSASAASFYGLSTSNMSMTYGYRIATSIPYPSYIANSNRGLTDSAATNADTDGATAASTGISYVQTTGSGACYRIATSIPYVKTSYSGLPSTDADDTESISSAEAYISGTSYYYFTTSTTGSTRNYRIATSIPYPKLINNYTVTPTTTATDYDADINSAAAMDGNNSIANAPVKYGTTVIFSRIATSIPYPPNLNRSGGNLAASNYDSQTSGSGNGYSTTYGSASGAWNWSIATSIPYLTSVNKLISSLGNASNADSDTTSSQTNVSSAQYAAYTEGNANWRIATSIPFTPYQHMAMIDYTAISVSADSDITKAGYKSGTNFYKHAYETYAETGSAERNKTYRIATALTYLTLLQIVVILRSFTIKRTHGIFSARGTV